jgi:general secretion pathway protein J
MKAPTKASSFPRRRESNSCFCDGELARLRGNDENWVGADGFTLIEMMVALLIFAMLAAAGVSLLTFSVRAQAAATQRLGAVADDQRMASLLASDLAQAMPRITRDVIGANQPAFRGTNGVGAVPMLRYVRGGWTNPDGNARASIQRVEIALDQGRLERRTYAMVDGTTAGPAMVLADNVENIRLRYRDKGGWTESWQNPAPVSMPKAVELIVKRKNRPALMMAFLVGATAK